MDLQSRPNEDPLPVLITAGVFVEADISSEEDIFDLNMAIFRFIHLDLFDGARGLGSSFLGTNLNPSKVVSTVVVTRLTVFDLFVTTRSITIQNIKYQYFLIVRFGLLY